MQRGRDVAVELPGLYLIHHNLPEKDVDWHEHAEHLLFVPLQGEIHVRLRSREISIGPGKMLYLPAGENHSFRSNRVQGERLITLIKPSLWKAARARKAEA